VSSLFDNDAELQVTTTVCNYYVDEGGDPTIFNRRGKVIVGTEGCSSYFLMGFLDIPNPVKLSNEMHELRQQLLQDPYFKNVPSMQPDNRKTALAFHAKDDLPEVRREVFRLLSKFPDVRFFAAVKSKVEEVSYIRDMQQQDADYRYHPNQLYEFLVWRMFTGCLHKADKYNVFFAKRGTSDRTQALRNALGLARQRSKIKNNGTAVGEIDVTVLESKAHHALQAVDYYCWALMRFYERHEDRYLDYLWPQFKVVLDVSDKRKTGAGVHYSQKKPLTLASLGEEISRI
jgi:hypothetical protein